ncbi:MAG TPA: enoyl-CoA hydratase-related protein [Candidatus Limnocylindria bacterium]|nr:enoyl-CoA hydratase-related protein [Candidatus Limnocylindria bacterium]
MTVRLDVDARGVASLVIARPERKNAFDAQVVADVTARLGEVPLDARCVVLRSEGDTFCAGADVEWMRSMADYSLADNVADSRALAAMFAALDELPMPLLARVQGAAIGGGAGLVAVSDIALASRDATFAFSEVRLGILPAVISPYVIRKCGVAFTTAAFMTGMRFDAKKAEAVGLVQSVEDGHHELDAKLGLFIEAILLGGPHAVNAVKRLVREVAGRPVADVRELTVQRIAAIRVSDEGQDGLRAFLEKRPPRWR